MNLGRLVVFALSVVKISFVSSFSSLTGSKQLQDKRTLCAAAAKASSSSFSSFSFGKKKETTRDTIKQQLLNLLERVPRNSASSRAQTDQILQTVRELEPFCPTDDGNVWTESAGTWELRWTAQDVQTQPEELLSIFRWINPLENQAYSNNPRGEYDGGGRANPVLPLPAQEFLTQRGFLLDDDNDDENNNKQKKENDNGSAGSRDSTKKSAFRVSTQTINVQNKRVVNVVTLPLRGTRTPATLTVRVDFTPDIPDPRRIRVKFQSFAVNVGRRFQLDLPLRWLGPTGWLRTTYLDDDLRITRGHKGSVFILKRPSNN